MPDRILVVEDEEGFADLLGMLLTRKGYEAKVAYSGKDAIETASSFRPDIIIQDYMLPDIGGVNLLSHLKKACPETNLIVITAKGSEDVAVDVMKSGAIDYLKKPFDTDRLLAAIDNTLKLRASQAAFRKLRRELRHKNNALLAVNGLSSALVSSMPADEAYRTAASIILKNMKADLAEIFVVSGHDGKLTLSASQGPACEGSAECGLPERKGLVYYVAGRKRPASVNDFRNEERFAAPAEVKRGLVSGFAAPMLVKDGLVGVLAVYYRDCRALSPFEIKLLVSFAELLALSANGPSHREAAAAVVELPSKI